MASLGTLAAELKLEGAAGMMSGLRAAGGAVSGLGQVLGRVQAPLAQLDSALKAVQDRGAGTSTAVTPVQAAAEAIRQMPAQAGRAAAALQTLGKAGAGMLGAFARPKALSDLAMAAERLPNMGRMAGPLNIASRPGGEKSRVNLGAMPRLARDRAGASVNGLVLGGTPAGKRRLSDAAVSDGPRLAVGADFARGLRGVLEPFRAGLRGSGRAAGVEGHGTDPVGAGAGLAAMVGQLRAVAGRSRTITANVGAAIGGGSSRGGESDRLARIGGFIGGGGGPALDFHRRTAAATEKTAASIQSLLQRLPAAEKPLTALWA